MARVHARGMNTCEKDGQYVWKNSCGKKGSKKPESGQALSFIMTCSLGN